MPLGFIENQILECSDYIDEALMHFKNGFSCMKVKLGFGINEDIEVYKEIHKVLEKKTSNFLLILIMRMGEMRQLD